MRIIVLVLVAVGLIQAKPSPLYVSWSRSPEALANKFVLVTLQDGFRLEGTWVSVTPSAFTMLVSEKIQTVPRSTIVRVQAGKRRVRGRIAGIVIGFYSIVEIGVLATGHSDATQGPIGIAAIGGAILGYFVGKAYDPKNGS